ncbi:unnamed protein product (mitochondrion) [Plasmodiophora brassicae]|uniref:Helicase ATP-binding domain-containing protein n=1 Tax=Plasmodiophora brassicae TaxID=37360 RepID=A0A0G4IQY8_PLABS|nr:hypothetical protein PBRA_005887 [Plasmodiophora brassicae]SPQ98320.1 unnamed protein product [Plasmodiophora brassicae]
MAMKGGGAGPPATIEEGAGPPAHLPVPPDDDDVLPDIVDDDRSPLKIFDGNLARMRLPRSLPPSAPWIVEANVASTLDIDGVRVHFPNAKPFHTQVAMMTSMIGAFRASRHALIESPTGTGKSLALLCAAIGFQIHQYEQVAAGRSEAVIPRIILASRTHSQLVSLAGELRRSPYRPRTTTLASRKQLCCNLVARSSPGGTDDACSERRHERYDEKSDKGCVFFMNLTEEDHAATVADAVRGSGGSDSVMDIEDLMRLSRYGGYGCPYYTSREVSYRSHLVLVPYNYVIDPAISQSLDLTQDSIVIIDEGHNVLDVAMEVGSADVTRDELLKCVQACDALRHVRQEKLSREPSSKHRAVIDETYPRLDVVRSYGSRIQAWLHRTSCQFRIQVKEQEPDDEYVIWSTYPPSSPAPSVVLRGLDITSPVCREIQRLLKAWSEAAPKLEPKIRAFVGQLHPMGALANALALALVRPHDYRICIVRSFDKGESQWYSSLRVMCLSAEGIIAMQTQPSFSFVITSGTLSPMGAFRDELGNTFKNRLDAMVTNPHVVRMADQVLVGAIGVDDAGMALTGTMKGQCNSYFAGVGQVVARICTMTPHGVLVFVSSYNIMNKFLDAWKRAGLLQIITRAKGEPFVEPNYGGDEMFKKVCIGYRNAAVTEKGALLLAVYRGKASEGISFSDNVCRACICVSLPLASYGDVRIQSKLDHENARSGNGRRWYERQAYSAVNQALGRVIRHAADYGILLMVDKRFATYRHPNVTTWLRQHVEVFETVEVMTERVNSFFQRVRELAPFTYVPPKQFEIPTTCNRSARARVPQRVNLPEVKLEVNDPMDVDLPQLDTIKRERVGRSAPALQSLLGYQTSNEPLT